MKLHVEDDRLNGGKSVGDVLLLDANRSESLAALIDSGLRATLPGVMLGSSSIFLIWDPCERANGVCFVFVGGQRTIHITFQGFPGSNSGTKSVNAAAGDCCDEGQSLFSLSGVESGHPSLMLRPDDHVLEHNGPN